MLWLNATTECKTGISPLCFSFSFHVCLTTAGSIGISLADKVKKNNKKKPSSKITLVKINSVTYGQRDVAMIADGKPLHGELFFGRKSYFNDLNREMQFISELTKVPQAAK